jgi:hypothetical protein
MSRVRAVITTALVLSSLLLLTVGPAAALPLLRFDQGDVPAPGSVSWAGGSAPLVGTDIVFQWVTGTDTPANSGAQVDCDGCVLNFVTGTYAGAGIWNPGGSFTLTGDLVGVADSGALLTGHWISSVTMLGGSFQSIFVGEGADTKDAALLSYFGFASDVSFNFASTIITGPVSVASGSFDAEVTNADITNVAVPEPGTLLLLGGGISALALRRRRKSS